MKKKISEMREIRKQALDGIVVVEGDAFLKPWNGIREKIYETERFVENVMVETEDGGSHADGS